MNNKWLAYLSNKLRDFDKIFKPFWQLSLKKKKTNRSQKMVSLGLHNLSSQSTHRINAILCKQMRQFIARGSWPKGSAVPNLVCPPISLKDRYASMALTHSDSTTGLSPQRVALPRRISLWDHSSAISWTKPFSSVTLSPKSSVLCIKRY